MEFYKKPLFKEFSIALIAVALLHHIAIYFYLYWSIPEFDSLLHFLGGVLFSFFILWVYFFSGFFNPKNRGLGAYLLISILGVVFISVVWEIFELVAGIAVSEWSMYPLDTTTDYVMDFLGGLAASLYAFMKTAPDTREVPEKKGFVPENLPV